MREHEIREIVSPDEDRPSEPHRDDTAGSMPGEVERSVAETDQDLSDADQTLADADQTLAEGDQARSAADQRASDRDQAASDREFGKTTQSAEAKSDHDASEQERAVTSEARREGAELRAGSMLGRVAQAAKRDEVAELRDMQASVRDRTADLRDEASEAHERELGRIGSGAASARATAALDRVRAAEDRKRAAEDRKRAAEDRQHALAEVEKAQMDDLTGFYRSRLGHVVLQNEIDRARRSGSRLAFIYFDVDGLKKVNDTEGHDHGDRLLRAVATAIRSRLRSYDPVVRIGGDEFVSAIPGTGADDAERVARDVQKALSEECAGATMSYGLSTIEDGDTADSMIKRSDAALRASKAARD